MRQLSRPATAVMVAAVALTAAASTASATAPAAASRVPAASTVVLRHPPPGTVPNALRSNYNNIWAGHEVPNSLYGGKKITAVVSQWIQPKVPADSNFHCNAHSCVGPDASEWTGFDGRGPGLIQAGCDSLSATKATYFCWWEDFPGPTHEVPVTVKPGETVYVSIQYLGHDKTKFYIKTDSGHWGPKTEKTPSVGQTTALFIVERLMNAKQTNGYYLPDFGSVTFLANSFFQGSLTNELTSGKNVPAVMVNGCSSKDKTLATPGNIVNLDQFTVSGKASRPYTDKLCK